MKYISNKATIVEPCIFGKNIYIGPYSIIGPNVEIGDNVWIDSNVVICGSILIGSNNHFFSFSKVLANCKNYYFSSGRHKIIIGHDNVFCEASNVFSNLGFISIGSKNYFMANSFISDNCILGDNTFLSYNVSLSNNVFIDDFVTLDAFVHVKCNVSIGCYSFIGSYNNICSDVLPYMLVSCYPNKFELLNMVFLKRYFFKKSSILRLKNIYKNLLTGKFTKVEVVSLLLSKKYFSFETKVIVDFLLKSNMAF